MWATYSTPLFDGRLVVSALAKKRGNLQILSVVRDVYARGHRVDSSGFFGRNSAALEERGISRFRFAGVVRCAGASLVDRFGVTNDFGAELVVVGGVGDVGCSLRVTRGGR